MKLIEDLGKCLVLTYTKWGILLYSWSLDTRTCDIATKSPLCYTPSLTKSRLKMFVELQYVHNGIKVNFWIPKKFNHEIWAYFVKSKLIVERGDVLKTVQYGFAGILLLRINDQLICSTVPGRCQSVLRSRSRFFFGRSWEPESGAGAACFKGAPAPAASLRQAIKQGSGSGSAWIQEGKFVN